MTLFAIIDARGNAKTAVITAQLPEPCRRGQALLLETDYGITAHASDAPLVMDGRPDSLGVAPATADRIAAGFAS